MFITVGQGTSQVLLQMPKQMKDRQGKVGATGLIFVVCRHISLTN
jgi:hypothetical protein